MLSSALGSWHIEEIVNVNIINLQEMLPIGMKMSNYSAAALADVILYISLWEKHFFEKQ